MWYVPPFDRRSLYFQEIICIRDHPLIVYSIDIDLQDYIEGVNELDDEKTATEILREYLENKTNDKDLISRQIELIEQVGIQYLIVDLEPSRELEALDIFANKVIKKVS